MTKTPSTFSAALLLILLNALFWLGFAVMLATGTHPSPPQSKPLLWAMAGLAVLAAIVLILLCYFLRKRNKFAFYLTLAILATLILLSITDDFGFSDLIYLILTALPLALLIANRKWYLGV